MPDHESREQLLSEIANLQKQVEELHNLENRHASAEAPCVDSKPSLSGWISPYQGYLIPVLWHWTLGTRCPECAVICV